MKLQIKPNPWSCIGSAFAMVLDIPVADFFGHVGHDGSQKAFPMLPDPMARRGLHIQECIAACLKLGYAVTPIELFPVIRATLLEDQKPSPCGVYGNAHSQCVNRQQLPAFPAPTSP